jgi:hypothetical protein
MITDDENFSKMNIRNTRNVRNASNVYADVQVSTIIYRSQL